MTIKVKTMDAIALLKTDHKKVKALFDQFEKAESKSEKEKIVEDVIKELRVHATIEEEMFYPAVKAEFEKEDDEELLELVNEADEEHRVAKTIIKALEDLNSADEHYDAKFMVLAENVRHHIKEEEEEMFPEVRKTDLDLKAIGEQLMERKTILTNDEGELKEAEEESEVQPYQEPSKN